MPAKRTNRIIHIEPGINPVAWVDVSTPKYPDAVTQIDEVDLHLMLDGGGWFAVKFKKRSNTLYVSRHSGGRKGSLQLLHRRILGLTNPKIQGDHRNGDGLDNRRENLRAASNQRNSQNGVSHRDGTSKYRGVSWDKDRSMWTAGIGINGKRHSVGRFDDEVAAAKAYDKAAIRQFGEFARPNFPEKNRGK